MRSEARPIETVKCEIIPKAGDPPILILGVVSQSLSRSRINGLQLAWQQLVSISLGITYAITLVYVILLTRRYKRKG